MCGVCWQGWGNDSGKSSDAAAADAMKAGVASTMHGTTKVGAAVHATVCACNCVTSRCSADAQERMCGSSSCSQTCMLMHLQQGLGLGLQE